MPWEEVQKFLPQYLSAESSESLFQELNNFPANLDQRLYTTCLTDKNIIFQGDGLKLMPLINFPEKEIYESAVMVLSNTCDNSIENERYIAPNLIYAPIIKISKLVALLEESEIEKIKIDNLVFSIKKQRVTQLFYLPAGDGVEEESIVFFDKVNSSENYFEPTTINDLRFFSLSDYGFYLLLIKLSIHFTRIREKVERSRGIIL